MTIRLSKGEQYVWEKYKSEFIFDNGVIRVYPDGWYNGHPIWKVEKGGKKSYYINCEEEIWIMRCEYGCNVAFDQHLNPRFPLSLIVEKDLTQHYKRLDKLLEYVKRSDDKKEFILLMIMIFNRVQLYLPMEMVFHLIHFMREIDFLGYQVRSHKIDYWISWYPLKWDCQRL